MRFCLRMEILPSPYAGLFAIAKAVLLAPGHWKLESPMALPSSATVDPALVT